VYPTDSNSNAAGRRAAAALASRGLGGRRAGHVRGG
jgi:hypothetical protein